MGLMAPSATLMARARPFFTSSWRAMNSGLPPSRMSVPRPAMLVAMVTMPRRPACATYSASRSCNLAFSTTWRTPLRCRMAESRSDFSIEVVPTSTGCCFSCSVGDVVGDGLELFLLGAVDDVGIFDAQQRLVGGDDDDFELVDLLEFGGFGFGRAGHAAELLVEAEVVLEGDGGQRLVFLADVDAFLGLDGLVQSVGPAAAGHQAAGEGVDDDDFAVLDHVFDVALVERVGLDGGFDVVLEFPVLGVGDVVDAERFSMVTQPSSVTPIVRCFSSTT